MTETYATSQGLEQAVKSAAKRSGRPVDKTLEEYWRSRFLARVFSQANTSFVLKGGTGLLARIPDARKTRDLDLTTTGMHTIEDAIDELVDLASHDLGDFFRFQFLSSEIEPAESAHRMGAGLKFEVYMGVKRLTILNIDLVIGCSPTDNPEFLRPQNLNGFPLSNIRYRVYPLVDHIADKVCAIMELHGDSQVSSRMKDLVDLCIIATHESVDLRPLARALKSEAKIRDLGPLQHFVIPATWHEEKQRYARTAKDANLKTQYSDLSVAYELTKSFIDPALNSAARIARWNPDLLTWE